MPKALIVFDIDGTLIDSGDIIFAALSQTLHAFGRHVPERQRALHVVGLSLHEAFLDLTGGDNASAAMAEHYKGLFGPMRASGQFPEPLYPGASAAVETLRSRAGTALGIATGKSRRGVDHLLQRLGWEHWFSLIQTADDAPSKPHPAMLLQAAALAGISPAQAVMIGDSVHDMRMAKAAGTRAIGVGWGFHTPDALRDAGAEIIVNRFDTLSAAIDELIG